MDVNGKVVLITGASEGIGAATARLLAARGAKVALAARSIDKLNEVAGELGDSFAVRVDMTQHASITAMVDAVVENYGRIDVLVNNAGRALRARVADVNVADFQSIVDLNVYGPLLAMQVVIPHMRSYQFWPTARCDRSAGRPLNLQTTTSAPLRAVGPVCTTDGAVAGHVWLRDWEAWRARPGAPWRVGP